MSLSPPEWATIFGPIIGILSIVITLIFRWLRRPKLKISRIITKSNWDDSDIDSPKIIVGILFRNVGQENTDFLIKATLTAAAEKMGKYDSDPIIYEDFIESGKSIRKEFNFRMPLEAKIWKVGIITIRGDYLDKNEKRKKIKTDYGSYRPVTIEWSRTKTVRFFHMIRLRIGL